MAPLPEAPPDEPAATFDGLDTRARQATADAAEGRRRHHCWWCSIATPARRRQRQRRARSPIASVVKLFIADDLLLQESRGKTSCPPTDRRALDVMLRSSDDSAAEEFWNRSGGSAIVTARHRTYGLGSTRRRRTTADGSTRSSTTGDLVRYYDKLLAGTGGLPPEQASIILANLAASTPTAPDGTVPGGVYPQRSASPRVLRRAGRGQAGLVLLLERREPDALCPPASSARTAAT